MEQIDHALPISSWIFLISRVLARPRTVIAPLTIPTVAWSGKCLPMPDK
jgi:hypothetical protein